MSAVSPARSSTVSFQTRLGSGWPSLLRMRNRPAPWMWKGWCMGWSEFISLTRLILTLSPTVNFPAIRWLSPLLPVRPVSDQVGVGDEHTRCPLVGLHHPDRLPGLDEHRLVVLQRAEGRDQGVVGLPA